jgi:hypothetical protein
VAGGKVFAFTSATLAGVTQYQLCGVASGGVGFGQRLQAVRQAGGASGANLVVANPASSELTGFMVFVGSGGGCVFSSETAFSQTGAIGTRYGDSLAQVAAASGGAASIAIAAPDNGALGATTLLRDATIPGPIVGGGVPTPIGGLVRSGSTVAGYHGSGLYLVGAPQSDSGRGAVSLYSSGDESSPALCTLVLPGAQPGDRFAATVAHLNDAFPGLVGAGNIAGAASSAEFETGGSVTIFAAAPTGCSTLAVYNNCQNDPLQEQGATIEGGPGCVTVDNGVTRKMLLVGSPGWSNHRGRVDIAVEGGELGTTEACFDPATATSTSTVTPEPSATSAAVPTLSAIPTFTVVPTFTHVFSATPTPALVVSPQPSPPIVPTVWVGTPHDTPGAENTPSDGGQVVVDSTPTPVAVFPGASGLPTPEVREVKGMLEVGLPEVTPQLSQRDKKRAVRTLLKKNRRLSRKRAENLLANPANLVITYIVQYSVVEQARVSRFSLIESAYAAPPSSHRAARVNRVRTRNTSVALGRIQRGATYRVAYQVEIALKKPRVVIGTTRLSPPTVFKAS